MISTLALFIVVHGQQSLPYQQGKWLDSYAYSTGKWSTSPKELIEFRKSVFKLWQADVPDDKVIDSLFVKYRKQYLDKKSNDSLARMLIIESFFPNRHYRHKFDLYYEMRANYGLNNYEYARAAFCLFAMQQNEQTPWKHYEALKAQWPEDPGLYIAVLDGWATFAKDKKLPSISILPKMAEEAIKQYPSRDEQLKGFAAWAYYKHWGRTKDQKSLLRAIELSKQLLGHSQVSQPKKDALRRMIAKYEPYLKRG